MRIRKKGQLKNALRRKLLSCIFRIAKPKEAAMKRVNSETKLKADKACTHGRK
jgi:hypothetical protein